MSQAIVTCRWIIFLFWLLSLAACGEFSAPITPTGPSTTSHPPVTATTNRFSTATPTFQPATATPVINIPGPGLVPEEPLPESSPTPYPTIDPAVVARFPRLNGLPVLPVFAEPTALSLPLLQRKANYGPENKLRVGIQAGHWKAENHPDELQEFRHNTGAQGGGLREVDLNLQIAQEVAALLEAQGVQVDLLPATPPVNYTADLFVALHADGDTTGRGHGFKIARSRYSLLPQTDDALVAALYKAYGAATDLPRDDNHISPNMLGYFAFNNRRYLHAINPYTPAAILEMGYVTSEIDRAVFIHRSHDLAQGIATGIMDFLNARPALEFREQSAVWPVIETLNDHVPLYTRPDGRVVGYLSKGQRFDWFENKDTYYLVSVPSLKQVLFVKKSDFRTFSEALPHS